MHFAFFGPRNGFSLDFWRKVAYTVKHNDGKEKAMMITASLSRRFSSFFDWGFTFGTGLACCGNLSVPAVL